MEKQVDVRIDEAGQQGAVAEVDYLRTLRMGDAGTHFHNQLTADEQFAGSQHAPGFDIQQAVGVENRRGLSPGSRQRA
jgi:hypothetical protein